MWIEIIGGPKPLWLKEADCFDKDGNSCSTSRKLPPWSPQPIPLPDWFAAPEGSNLRDSFDWGFPGMSREEARSMRGTADQVVKFYENCVRAGGLTIKDSIVVESDGRTAHYPRKLGPGFDAESADYHFGIDLWEHSDTTFWTIQHHAKIPLFPRPKPPAYRSDKVGRWVPDEQIPKALRYESEDYKLSYIEISVGRITLRHEASGEQYSAATSSLLETRPPRPEHKPPPKSERIRWSNLPLWAQFELKPDSVGHLFDEADSNHRPRWGASTGFTFRGCTRCMFQHCLDTLNGLGFDPVGRSRPDHTYFIKILQGGAYLDLCARSESGDEVRINVLNTLGHISHSIRYTARPGTPKPPTLQNDDLESRESRLRRSFIHKK